MNEAVANHARSLRLADGMGSPPASISVAIFAYNEQRLIGRCLDSVLDDSPEAAEIYVLINGCTDRTEQIVAGYAARDGRVRPIVIARGDKANAWNHYVHVLAPGRDIHAFMDGDMRVRRGSFAGIAAAMAAHPRANGVAALPASGRSRARFRQKLLDKHELAGNFYAVRGRALEAFRDRGVRLPFGMFGEDGLVATLLKWDLEMSGPERPERVVACPEAEFVFDPLGLLSRRDWGIYRNRRMRYAVRYQQSCMLYPLLFEHGVAAIPAHVVDLYRNHGDKLELRFQGLNTLFDLLAIRRIRRRVHHGPAAKEIDEARLYS